MIRRPPRSTQLTSSAASDVYKRQEMDNAIMESKIPDNLNPDEINRYLLDVRYDWESTQ